jgi:type IV secretion system protein VirB4
MDGDHYTLGGEEGGVTFQPLRDIDDLLECEWAQSWVEGLCEGQRVLCTPAQRQELWDALTGMAALPVHLRTLTGLTRLVQDAEIRQALHPYTMAGAYGRVLDAVAEPLALRPWSCFETDRLFQVPQLVAPTLGVLFHQLATAFQEKKPTFFVLDEAWRYLAHMTFRDQIEEWLRELRKLHVNIVFSTQDVYELLESPISSVIRNNCKIRFFLPNRQALEPDIRDDYRRMGLNDRQIELIATAQPHRDYLLHTKDGCRLIDLALGPVQLSLLTKGELP